MTHSLFGNLPLISMASPGSDTHKRTSAVQVNATSESYHCQLQEWKDLARWRQDNEYIISGYVGMMLVDGVSIQIWVAASSGGVIIVDDTLTLAGGKK